MFFFFFLQCFNERKHWIYKGILRRLMSCIHCIHTFLAWCRQVYHYHIPDLDKPQDSVDGATCLMTIHSTEMSQIIYCTEVNISLSNFLCWYIFTALPWRVILVVKCPTGILLQRYCQLLYGEKPQPGRRVNVRSLAYVCVFVYVHQWIIPPNMHLYGWRKWP